MNKIRFWLAGCVLAVAAGTAITATRLRAADFAEDAFPAEARDLRILQLVLCSLISMVTAVVLFISKPHSRS